MFGLIPLVITIILAGIITGMVAYFSGDVFSGSSERAVARKAINEGEQLVNAINMYRFDKGMLEVVDGALVLDPILDSDRYYRGSGITWTTRAGGLSTSIEGGACAAINSEAGYDGAVPACDSIPVGLEKKKYYCCSDSP
jgi:hypothetical protein